MGISSELFTASHIGDWTSKDSFVPSQAFHSYRLARKCSRGFHCLQFEKVRAFSYIWVCLMGNTGTIDPPQGCKQILEELHDTHLGVSCMGSLVRS